MSKYRLSDARHRAEEWRVYNSNYQYFTGGRCWSWHKPWIAYHPDQNVFTFATHAEAIEHINKVEDGDIW